MLSCIQQCCRAATFLSEVPEPTPAPAPTKLGRLRLQLEAKKAAPAPAPYTIIFHFKLLKIELLTLIKGALEKKLQLLFKTILHHDALS